MPEFEDSSSVSKKSHGSCQRRIEVIGISGFAGRGQFSLCIIGQKSLDNLDCPGPIRFLMNTDEGIIPQLRKERRDIKAIVIGNPLDDGLLRGDRWRRTSRADVFHGKRLAYPDESGNRKIRAIKAIELKLLTEKPIIDRIVPSHTRYRTESLSEHYSAIIS
jgi:hypothetical protein